MDYGTGALLDTCDTLDEAGISRVGAGKNLDEAKAPVILEAQGKKIGFLEFQSYTCRFLECYFHKAGYVDYL